MLTMQRILNTEFESFPTVKRCYVHHNAPFSTVPRAACPTHLTHNSTICTTIEINVRRSWQRSHLRTKYVPRDSLTCTVLSRSCCTQNPHFVSLSLIQSHGVPTNQRDNHHTTARPRHAHLIPLHFITLMCVALLTNTNRLTKSSRITSINYIN